MDTTRTIRIEPGNRIALPEDWVKVLGLSGLVTIHKLDDGIAIRPGHRFTWDEIFATKLTVRPADPATVPQIMEISGDDLLV